MQNQKGGSKANNTVAQAALFQLTRRTESWEVMDVNGPTFASGNAFASSILNRVFARAFYSPSAFSVLGEFASDLS